MKREILYHASPDVFAMFPGYRRGVVLGFGVDNGASSSTLIEALRGAEEAARNSLEGIDIAQEPRIAWWREAFRTMGVKPTEYRPSVEALVRRVLRGDALPSISRLVDIGNVVSLTKIIPVGAHAVDLLREGLELRLAVQGDTFTPFGSEETESPPSGEVVLADGHEVVTRRWVWRQARHTVVTNQTSDVEFNVDAMPGVDTLDEICDSIARLVRDYCGGTTRVGILSAATPTLPIYG